MNAIFSRLFLLFPLLLILGTPLAAQKMLILEKYGSAKVKKFYVGDELRLSRLSHGRAGRH